MIVNYDHFYYWRQTTLSAYVDIHVYVRITCTVVSINEAKEKLSVNIVSKKKEEKRESNKTNHFWGRLRNKRLIVDDDTTRHTYWHKMVPTCIVCIYVYMRWIMISSFLFFLYLFLLFLNINFYIDRLKICFLM